MKRDDSKRLGVVAIDVFNLLIREGQATYKVESTQGYAPVPPKISCFEGASNQVSEHFIEEGN